MPDPITVAVSNCASCPFAYAREDDYSDEWTCTAAEDRNGFLREIGKTQKKPGAPWLPPPTWCPLRQAERVVRFVGDKRDV